MWRNEDLVKVLADSRLRARRRDAARAARRTRARSPQSVVDAGIAPHAPPRVAADARHRRLHVVPGDARRHRHRDARAPPLRRRRAVADRAARAGHADGDRRRRVRQADGARARRGRGDGHALRHLVAPADHQLGRDVVARDQAGAHGARATSSASTRSARAKASASRARSARPARRRRPRKFTIGASTKVFTDDGREVEPGSDEVGMLAVGGHIPVGYYKDERKSAATFRTINGERWSVPGDFARVEADGSIVLLGRGSVVHQLGRREGVPRRGRGGGEGAPRRRRLPRGRRARRAVRRSGDRGRRAPRRARRSTHERPRPRRSTRSRATSGRGGSCSCPRSCAAPTARPTTSGPRPTAAADSAAQ